MSGDWIKNLDAKDQDLVKKSSFPTWVEPMLATLTDEPFSDPEWIFERKLDGVRCLIYKYEGDIKLGSRNQKDQTVRYPEIVASLDISDDHSFIADGEIVAFDGKVTSFSRLQNRMQLTSPQEEDIKRTPVEIYLFDLIWLDGYDIRNLKLRDRKSLLRKIFNFNGNIHYAQHRNEDGEAYFKEACRKDWEGLIAKDATSEYVYTRSRKWLKFKCSAQQEFVIGGYTEPHGERTGFGAILVGYYENEQLFYAGKVGTGFDDDELKLLYQKFSSLEQRENPFNEEIDEKGVHFIKPELVGEIRFTEWTSENKLRHPSYLGLRNDKPPREVVREKAR